MQFREIVSGLGFLEGPAVLPDGRLVVTDVEFGTLVVIDVESGTTEVLAETRGGPNGAALGPDGALYICNNGGLAFVEHNGFKGGNPSGTPRSTVPAGIQRVTLEGEVTELYTECEGRPLLKPNDLVFDAHGGIWFTDTGAADGRLADLGGVYYATADGTSITEVIHTVRPTVPVTQPNGVGLSPDGATLHVAETGHCRLASYQVVSPGRLSDAAPSVAYGPTGAMFDSLAIDRDGNVCVATLEIGGITVLSPTGEVLEFVELPVTDPRTTNLCFGGPDLDIAYVTSGGRGAVWEITGFRSGLALNY